MAFDSATFDSECHPARYVLHGLAVQALAKLAVKAPRPRRASLDNLCDALIDGDESRYLTCIAAMIADGAASTDVLDRIIPEAARLLGSWWLSDKASFSDVTIGTSRLQQAARNLGARHARSGLDEPLGHRVLMILPEAEQHSLGPFIVANQLRRRGVWVQMALAPDARQLERLIETQPLSMIGLSLGTVRSLEQADTLIATIRSTGAAAPVVIGGYSVDHAPIVAGDLGADLISSDTLEAIDFCRMKPPTGATLLHEVVDA